MGLFVVRRAIRLSKLVVMSSCLDESKSCCGWAPAVGLLVSTPVWSAIYEQWELIVGREWRKFV